MLTIFNTKRKMKEGLKQTDSAREACDKVCSYSKEIFGLNNQAVKEFHTLLKEEGMMTHNFNILLDGKEYTTKQIQKVEAHLHSLSRNSENTRGLVDTVFESLQHSSREIGNSRKEMNSLTVQMNSVSDVFQEFFSLFTELQNHYANIDKFANIITNIASQTNLLSLNASIEAARVGEAGKGFAVVANEIKKLSVDTQNSTKDIMESLKKMTAIIDLLNAKSNEGTKVVSDTAQLIRNSDTLLDNIVDAENKVHEHLKEVKGSQNQNLSDIQEIAGNLRSIVDKSIKENKYLEELIFSVQKKADFYLYVLNYLNQIKLLYQKSET